MTNMVCMAVHEDMVFPDRPEFPGAAPLGKKPPMLPQGRAVVFGRSGFV